MAGTIRVAIDVACARVRQLPRRRRPAVHLGDDDIAEPVPPEQPESARAALESVAHRCPTGAITLTDA